LNDKNKRYRRAPVTKQPSEPADDEEAERVLGETSLKDHTPERSHSLVWKEPWIAPVVRPKALSPQPEPNPSTFTRASRRNSPTEHLTSSITAPIIRFYSTIGTYSTEFGLVRESDGFGLSPLRWPAVDTVAKPKGTKRVRIAEPSPEPPNKKVRTGAVDIQSTNKEEHVTISSEESEDHYSSSSTSTSDEEDATSLSSSVKAKAKARVKAKAKSKTKKQRDKKPPPPTLLERLTGLTGDLDGPVYQPPKPKSQIQKTYQGWAERKKAQFNKQQRERKYAESQDPVDKFKKLCCTLVIAASMADGDGCVDWSIVEKVHNTKGFNLPRTKTLWGWMQTNMAPEIATLTADFEARFLEAYEDGRIAAIEDPAAYDWANLIRWAMHHCIYPELSLPVYREALRHFIVDLSSFEVLDRPKWYREKTADRVRTQLQLWYPFTAPLHRSGTPKFSVDERELKARSWIRANTATPQALYDSKTAHEKLSTLGNTVLAKVVGEYVHRQMLRMRKLKRLLPGRNYTFTARLAKKYGRTFELGDFMAAVKIKKDMDAAFKQEDREKRIYSLSRAEPDGAIMAVMTLLSEGKVRFVPKLPSVNSEFGAPLPRLSVWGFCEGDYVHRGIDRQRLFWDVHVVPTSSYDYGNPLQPSHDLSLGERTYCPETWSPLPQPPLPGKYDSNALLPIWSSMDGQNITWPWWYRILNLVLQPLIFQPGATVEDIHDNCDEYTTEIFEIKLVLQWLISVKAVKMTVGGGYITMPGVWATFGDVLHDMNDDWLNAHVRRKHNKQQKQQWRESYHLRYSALQGRNGQQDLSGDSGDSDTQTDDEHDALTSTRLNIIRHPKAQYAILREQVEARTPVRTTVGTETANTVEQTIRLTAASKHDVDQSNDFNSPAVHNEDIDMEDADGETEANAEWEVGG
jgi:transcription factor C subunit 3